MSGCYFDQLIKDGKTAEALRYFAKEGYENGDFGHTRKQLVEQAAEQVERVQELEELVKDYKAINKELHQRGRKVRKQNKRYRDALEFYADEGTYEVVETLPPTDEYHHPIEPVFNSVPIIYYDRGREARRALEGEE